MHRTSETSKTQAEIVRTNCIRTLKNSQKFGATKLSRQWAPLGKGYWSCSVVLVSTMVLGTQWAIRKCLLDDVLLMAPAVWLDQLYLAPSTCNRRRQWQPTPVLLPGKSHGRRSLVGCSPWGSLRVGHDWATSLSLFICMHWRRKWQPTPVFLPGESQGRGSLVGCRLWGCTESITTEVT